jgi:hypothetical protein
MNMPGQSFPIFIRPVRMVPSCVIVTIPHCQRLETAKGTLSEVLKVLRAFLPRIIPAQLPIFDFAPVSMRGARSARQLAQGPIRGRFSEFSTTFWALATAVRSVHFMVAQIS